MDAGLILLLILLTLAIIAAFYRGRWQLLMAGLKRAWETFLLMWWRVLLGFLLGGLIQVLVPREFIADWIGPTSGIKGVLIGSYAGLIITGNAFVIMPIIASIYIAGAGAGPIIGLLTASQMIRLQGLFILEIPFLGSRIALTRYCVCILIPPLAGLAGGVIFGWLT